MNLSEAVAKRLELLKAGVRCQIKHQGDNVWVVLLHGVDY